MMVMQTRSRLAVVLCLVTVLALAGLLVASCVSSDATGWDAFQSEVPPPPPPSPPPAPAAALLDGVVLPGEEAAAVNGRLPVAVMLDNLPGARPQVGLDRADLVYELLVEGGITRFMAVYLRRDADWIEPVRSARTPAVVLAKELDAVLAHVGAAHEAGEADAVRWMNDWALRTLDGDADETPYHRDNGRGAPHNMVTSTTALRARA